MEPVDCDELRQVMTFVPHSEYLDQQPGFPGDFEDSVVRGGAEKERMEVQVDAEKPLHLGLIQAALPGLVEVARDGQKAIAGLLKV
jgi:hypothetical protein